MALREQEGHSRHGFCRESAQSAQRIVTELMSGRFRQWRFDSEKAIHGTASGENRCRVRSAA